MGWQRPVAQFLVLTAWFAVLLVTPAYAETDPSPLLLLQVYGPVDDRDPGIERVLEQAMSLALERQGPFSVATAAFRDVGGEERLALNLAERQEFGLLIIGTYQLVDEGLRLDARLLKVDSRTSIAEISVTREIDLRLDRIAEAAAEALLAAAASDIARLIAARSAQPLTATPVDETPEVEHPDEPTESQPQAPKGPRYRVSGGPSLVVPVGRYANFFGPGPGGELALHRTFPGLYLGFSAGLLVSSPTREDTGEYARTFVPLLVEVGLPFATTGAVTWEAYAAAGAAIRMGGGSPITDRLAPALAAWRARVSAHVPVSTRVALIPHLTGMGAMQFYDGSPNGGNGGGVDHLLWFIPGAMASFAW